MPLIVNGVQEIVAGEVKHLLGSQERAYQLEESDESVGNCVKPMVLCKLKDQLRHGNPCNGCRNGFSQSFKSESYMKYRWELFLELLVKCGEILRAHLPKRLLYNVLLNNLLKLGTSECVPCLARPKRRQERVSLCAFRRSFEGSLRKFCGAAGHVSLADE